MSYDNLMNRDHHAPPGPSSRTPRAVPVAPSRLLAPLAAPRSLTADLVSRLTREIADGALPPGARLPTEQQMVAALGVSRTVVREAVAALKGDGLVVARQGAGVFVAEHAERRPFRIDPDALASLTNVLALMELRTGLEGEAAALAALRRTGPELRRLDQAMAALEAARKEGSDAAEADFAFHRAVMEATHNAYYRDFHRYLGQFILPRQSVRAMAVPPEERASHLARVQAEHQRIRDAIAARDDTSARDAALGHLRNSRERFGRLRAQIERRGPGG